MSILPTDTTARKRLKLYTYLMEFFPDAVLAEMEVVLEGAKQHGHNEKLQWSTGRGHDQMNKAFNHLFDYGTGSKKDTDGTWHLAKAIVRLKAQLQRDIEAERATNAAVEEKRAQYDKSTPHPEMRYLLPSGTAVLPAEKGVTIHMGSPPWLDESEVRDVEPTK